jgi:P-type E1-E2 ATPase
MVTIIRNGEQLYKHNKDIMVGDLVVVDNGMEIPADGMLVQASDLTADESAMTGNLYFYLHDNILDFKSLK